MTEFIIPVKMTSDWSLNKIYSGKHWQARKKDAETIHDHVKWILLAQKAKMYTSPVEISIEYDCRLDIDNCGYMAKLIIDGMKGIIIKDDTKKYVASLHQSFWDGGGIRVRVRRFDNDGRCTVDQDHD